MKTQTNQNQTEEKFHLRDPYANLTAEEWHAMPAIKRAKLYVHSANFQRAVLRLIEAGEI